MLHRVDSCGCKTDIPKSKAHIPRSCEHGGLYIYVHGLGSKAKSRPRKRGGSLKRTARRETAAEKRARDHFNEVVKGWWCFFREKRECEHCGGAGGVAVVTIGTTVRCVVCEGAGVHRCKGRKDAHHLVEKQWIRRNYADLPEDALLQILFCPQIGAPLCRVAHDGIKKHRIFWHELTPECIEFCEEVDRRWLEVRTTAGLRRQSMVERLRVECPEQEAVSTR
jgi:hypothetical protein